MSKIRLSLILVLVAMLGVLYVAHATATFLVNPFWNPTLNSYLATIEISGAPDEEVCWSVEASDDSAFYTAQCSCQDGDCLTSTPLHVGDGKYDCVIPGVGIANSPGKPTSIIGVIGPESGNDSKCPGTDNSIIYNGDHSIVGSLEAAPNGTGPNAVTLAGLDATPSTPWYVLPLGITGMLLIGGFAGFAIIVRRQ